MFAMKPAGSSFRENRTGLGACRLEQSNQARIRRQPLFGKSERKPVSRSNRNESSGSSEATVSSTNIRTETRSNTPWSCLSARKTVRPSNSITKKPKAWIISLRRRLLLWASPIPDRSFRPPVFRPISSRLRMRPRHLRANLPSNASGSSEPNTLQ